MPAGAKKCTNPEGTAERLSLEQAAQLSSDADARRTELQQLKFSGGAVRCWVLADRTTIDIRLYQFESADNATSFFDSDIEATGADYSAANTSDVSGVPGGQSFANPSKDSHGFVRVISIGRNADVVLVVALAQPAPVKVSVADTLLAAQYDKL
jgi:hypothetical protein